MTFVKVHVQVTSHAATNTVGKLAYAARGSFLIKKVLEADSYMVQRYGHPDAPLRKYKGHDLYLLPPVLFLSEPLDTLDERYLNDKHDPVPPPPEKTRN